MEDSPFSEDYALPGKPCERCGETHDIKFHHYFFLCVLCAVIIAGIALDE